MEESRRVLFLTKYSRLAASSRLRMYQYFPHLCASGWKISNQALLPDSYLQRLFRGEGRSAVIGISALAFRFLYLLFSNLRRYDVIVVQIEMLPQIPFFVERLFYAGARVVLDYDDAVFVEYKDNPLMRDKIARITGSAREVIVGSEVLRTYALQFNSSVTLIPTVVDLPRYEPKTSFALGNRVIIGWIGSSATTRYLETFSLTFKALAEKYPIVVRCVGARPNFQISGVNVEVMPWKEETEAELIREFDIGVMPLDNDEFSRGKCGYKLLQYMACSVPTVASAVGANVDIIRDDINGLLATDIEEFTKKIETLIVSEELRRRLGTNGRVTVKRSYCLDVRKSELSGIIERVAGSGVASQSEG